MFSIKKTGLRFRILSLLLAIVITFSINNNSSYAKTVEEDVYNPIPDKYTKLNSVNEDTILGMDFTYFQMQKNAWGKTWKDYKSQELDISDSEFFTFIKNQGVNTISVKICVNPDEKNDNKYLSILYASQTLKEAKAAGLKTNAVLTFSDELTYKGHQPIPAAWKNGDGSELSNYSLEARAVAYTESVIDTLKDQNATPDIITIGNELNYDFLDLSGIEKSWRGWSAIAAISNVIKAKNSQIKVAVSFAVPQTAAEIEWYINGDNSLNGTWCITQDATISAAYDYVGLSFYPTDIANNYAGDYSYLNSIISKYLEIQSAKNNTQPLILTGTNVPYISDTDANITMFSQMDGLYGLVSTITSNNNAGGIIWNEADMCGGWSSLFADDGTAVPTLRVFNNIINGADNEAIIDPYRFGGSTGKKDMDVVISKVPGMSESSIRGVDVSSCIALEEAGVKFYDNNGEEAPLFKVLSDNGINYVRIRIWNNPYTTDGKTYGGGKNDLNTALEICRRAQKYNMKVLLCFHYSDFWADPVQQLIPKDWIQYKGNHEALANQVYEFTKSSIQEIKETGVEIGMVQVGNEITNGILEFPTRIYTKGWSPLWKDETNSKIMNNYLKSGIKAVREESPDALITLHLESPNISKYETIMNTWERDEVDYDVLGTSCYPFWSTGTKSQSPEYLNKIVKLAAKHGKYCCVMETAWPTTIKEAEGTTNQIGDRLDYSAFDLSPQGQVDMLTAMYNAISGEPNGLGVFYWEPAWIPFKPGWCNWDYNKKTANKYGAGWASEGASLPDDICEECYFNKEKLYYNNEPTWGATSWENNALFDTYGYPLKSLAFYKESISSGEEHIVKIHNYDKDGNDLASYSFVKAADNTVADLTSPTLEGYTFEGWYSDSSLTNKYDPETLITANTEIFAKWKKNPEATDNKDDTTEAPAVTPTATPAGTSSIASTPTPAPTPDSQDTASLKNNTIKLKGKTITIKKTKIDKKNLKFKRSKAITVKKAKGKLTYKKASGNKNITINKKNGKITVKKGLKKGTYKIKVKVTAAGNTTYKKATKTVTFKIVIK